MAEREQRKRGPQVGSGELVPSRKKPRAYAIPQAVVKQDLPKEGPEEQQVGEAGHGAGAAAVEEQIDLRMALSLFRCRACLLPLKPPTFKCEAGHIVCGACRASHAQACAAATAACLVADAFVRDAKRPCAFQHHGCASYVAYYQAADHESACPWAPCYCPDPGCDTFTSPLRLLDHFRAEHPSWPVTSVTYGTAMRVALPPPAPQGLHVLVGEEDRSMFLVSSSALGAATAVSVVCVRANGDAAVSVVSQFCCKIWVPLSREISFSRNYKTVTFPMPSSYLLPGSFTAAEQDYFLAVTPKMARDASCVLTIRIDKTRGAAAKSTPTPAARSSGGQPPATA
ncbi:unnamed protein product [Urochloa humidicola]